MNYLLYVQYSAENLQFYLWLLDYEKRWKALPQSKQDLSPEWGPNNCGSGQNTGPPTPSIKKGGEPGSNTTELCALPRSPSNVFFPPGNDQSDNPFKTPMSSDPSLNLMANGSAVSFDTLPWSAPGVRSTHFASMAPSVLTAEDIRWDLGTLLYFLVYCQSKVNNYL